MSREAALTTIRADEAISETLRAAALQLVDLTRGEGLYLKNECRELCRSARSDRSDARVGLWQALLLQSAAPSDDEPVLLEGIARYRMGEHASALAALERSAGLRRSRQLSLELPAYSAMVLSRLGRLDDAWRELQKARAAMALPATAARWTNLELLSEAESVYTLSGGSAQ